MSHMNSNINNTVVLLKNVYKSFDVGDQSIEVLRDLNLAVNTGEFISVVGQSGSGKSTLLNMITGIDSPTSGEVIVTREPIHELTENELAGWRGTNIGIIFQFFQMLPALSLLQNVILPMDFSGHIPRRKRKQRATELLELVGLEDQLHKLPNMVSGGQQQRAAVARALANDPPLLVADEPTGNLDPRTADDVFQLFLDLASQGKTIIMVTHNHSLANQVPRAIELMNGQITRDVKSPPAGELK
ncbi:MAG TPA: ABC transporter ATP-binding protein [Chloroflexi bacterium]|nr:ABC transporter ATP-binding protein [Chloroflexota bacterium]